MNHINRHEPLLKKENGSSKCLYNKNIENHNIDSNCTLNFYNSQKEVSPKKNNNLYKNHFKKSLASPTKKITCMCNCSTNSSSVSQSLTSTPTSNQKLISNNSSCNDNNNDNNAIRVPIITLNNKIKLNDIKKSLDPIIDKEIQGHCHTYHSMPGYINHHDLEQIIKSHFGDFIKKIKDAIETSEMRLHENEKREIIQNEWSDLALVLDRLLFYFLSSLTIIATICIFLNSPHTFQSW